MNGYFDKLCRLASHVTFRLRALMRRLPAPQKSQKHDKNQTQLSFFWLVC